MTTRGAPRIDVAASKQAAENTGLTAQLVGWLNLLETGVSVEAIEVIAALRAAGHVDAAGAMSLEADEATLDTALAAVAAYRDAPAARRGMVQRVLRRSCYVNIWKVMGSQLDEATYMSIVRNKILVDVQGEDVLMQIFTSVVLQRTPGAEAPFLEFIERVCAQCRPRSTSSHAARSTSSHEARMPSQTGARWIWLRTIVRYCASLSWSRISFHKLTKRERRATRSASAA